MENKVIHILFSGLGGTTSYALNWIKAAKADGLECDVLFYGIEELNPETKFKFQELCTSVNFIHKQKKLDFGSWRRMKAVLRHPCKAIILHIDSLIIPVSNFKHGNTKLIAVEHQANHLKSFKRWHWSKKTQKKADLIVSLTQEYQDQLSAKLKNFKPDKNVVIPTGIDIDLYASNRNNSLELIIGAVGRLNSQRDFETLVLAMEGLDVLLEIAGDGEDIIELKKIAGENVTFLGELNSNEMVEFLKRIDIFIKPSFGETSSPAIMEAQAAGLPIIASKVSGIMNCLDEDNAILVETKNVTAYRNAIVELLENKERREKLARASRLYAEENISHHKMYALYKPLL